MEQPATRPYAASSPTPLAEQADQSLLIVEADHNHEQQGVNSEDWNQLQDLPAEDPVPIELPLQVDVPTASAPHLDEGDLYARHNTATS